MNMRATLHSTTFRFTAAAAVAAALLAAVFAALTAPSPPAVQAQNPPEDTIHAYEFDSSVGAMVVASQETTTAIRVVRNSATDNMEGTVGISIRLQTVQTTTTDTMLRATLAGSVGAFSVDPSSVQYVERDANEPQEPPSSCAGASAQGGDEQYEFSCTVGINVEAFDLVFTRGTHPNSGNGVLEPDYYRGFLVLVVNTDSPVAREATDPPVSDSPLFAVPDTDRVEISFFDVTGATDVLVDTQTVLTVDENNQSDFSLVDGRITNGVTASEEIDIDLGTPQGISNIEFRNNAVGSPTRELLITVGSSSTDPFRVVETTMDDVPMARSGRVIPTITSDEFSAGRIIVNPFGVAVLDDDRPEYGLRAGDGTALPSDFTLAEGGAAAEFTVQTLNSLFLSQNAELIISGATPQDTAQLSPGQATALLPARNVTTPASFSLGIVDDDIYTGGTRTVALVVTGARVPGAGPVGFDPQVLTVPVIEDDRPLVQAAVMGRNGNDFEFIVHLTDASPGLGVDLPVDIRVDAVPGLFDSAPPTSVVIPAGMTTTAVTLTMVSDGAFGGVPRDVSLTVLQGDHYDAVGDAARIADVADPDRPVVLIGNAGAVTLEREGGSQDLVVQLDGSSPRLAAPLTVGIDVDDPSDTLSLPDGGDLPDRVVIPRGQSSTVLTLQIVEDTIYEGGEDQVASVRLRGGAGYEVTTTATTLMLTVPDDDEASASLPPPGDLPPGADVLPPDEEGGTPVLEVQEAARALTLTLQTNYPENTVLALSLGEGEERIVRLEDARVTVGADGSVSIRLRPGSVSRTQDATLTLTPQGAASGLDAIVQPIRVDNEDVAAIFDVSAPQTGGAEPGAWLWLLAFAAAALLGAGALIARRRAAA